MTNMTWNRNMTEAPHDGSFVILASKCGQTMKSKFLVAEGRWNMYSTGEVPVAWMIWPEHPGLEGYDPATYVAPAPTGKAPAVTRQAPARETTSKGESVREPRAGGAKAICVAVYAEGFTDKAAFTAECVKRGVKEGTAKARFTDVVREASK